MILCFMLYFILLLALFAAILVYFKIADKFNIIDKPNQRSSHSRITLRGAGIIFYIGVLLWFLCFGFQYPWFMLGVTLIAGISFWDDVRPLPAKIRVIFHFAAMLLMFYQWGLFSMPWYFTLVALVVCTGIINAYNFMDGINGITGGYSLVVVGALWYIDSYQLDFVDNDLIIVVLLSLFVFCCFNFRKKAKCFAGDVGAVTIAFVILFMLGQLVIKTGNFSYLVLLAVYGVDSVLTITHRLMLKENIFEAHRKHAFQLMANELKMPHVLVSLIYMCVQLLVFAGFLYCGRHGYWYLGAVVLLLGIGYVVFMKKYFYLHERV